jgi:hypothetical protein
MARRGALREMLERARSEGVRDEVLARAKAYLLGNLTMDRWTNARHARQLDRVSAADVVTATRRCLVRPNMLVLRPPR